jgi:hypothetical protein
MKELVVTSFSPAGEALYGRRMVASFLQHWPARLVVYADGPTVISEVEVRRTADLTEWVACRQRWARDPLVHGRSTPTVRRKKPYMYQFDADRFAVKVFVWRDAARLLGAGVLTWLDGDTVVVRDVPPRWGAALLGHADVAYLGRGKMHPETGYVGFRIPESLPVLDWCCDAYASDRFRSIPGWTDCHVLRAALEAVPVRAVNLTAEAYDGRAHVWPRSPLAAYTDHFKGKQKRRVAA